LIGEIPERGVKRWFSISLRHALVLTLVAAGLSVGIVATSQVVDPATPPAKADTPPSSPIAGTQVYFEDFSNISAASAPVGLAGTGISTAYTGGAAARNSTYTASSFWLPQGVQCNGWVLRATTTTQPTAPGTNNNNCTNPTSPGAWVSLRNGASFLGQYQGQTVAQSLTNQALSEYTNGNTGNATGDQRMFQTNGAPVPATAGHFYASSAIAGATSCSAANPSLTFNLLAELNNNPANISTIALATGKNPCTDPSAQVLSGDPAGTGTTSAFSIAKLQSSAVQAPTGTTSIGLQLVNTQNSTVGNDGEFDSPSITDVTPQLDKNFNPTSIATGGTSTLTFTLTNTSELLAKVGITATDTLPAGVVVAPTPSTTTTCTNSTNVTGSSAAITAVAGSSSVGFAGSLPAQASCTYSVKVTSSAPGTYTNTTSSNVAGSGFVPKGSTTLTVTPAPLVCDGSTIYSVARGAAFGVTTGSGTVYALSTSSVGGASVTSTAVATIPQGSFANGLGISPGGTGMYVVDQSTTAANSAIIHGYNASTGVWTTYTGGGSAAASSFVGGAVDPVNGIYYYVNYTTTGAGVGTIYGFNTVTNTPISGAIGTFALPVPPGFTSNGDIAFDAAGNLFALASNQVNVAIAKIAGPLPTTGSANGVALTATTLSSSANTTAYNGIAFDNAGHLFASSTDTAGVTSLVSELNPNTGAAIAGPTALSSNAQTFLNIDLASCTTPPTLSLQKDIAGRVVPTDQFQLTISGTGITGGNTATTSGSTTGVQTNAIAGPVLAVSGDSYTLTETAASGDLANYTSSYSCVNTANGNAVVASGTGTSFTLTFPAASTPSAAVVCTFTNTPPPPPTGCPVPTVFDANGTPTILDAQYQDGGGSSFNPVGTNPGNWTYNAIAYNPADGYIYGVSSQGGGHVAGRLLRINPNTGVITNLGAITGMPAVNFTATTSANVGTFDSSGNYWIAASSGTGNGILYKVNLTTFAATAMPGQTTAVGASDMTYASGYFWGVVDLTGQIQRINPATGASTIFPHSSTPFLKLQAPPSGTIGVYGAGWTYVNGNIGFDQNSGGFVQISISNPTSASPTFAQVATGAGPASGNNDGTACGGPADLTVAKTGPATITPGGTVNWTITATNAGPGFSSGFVVNDTIPAAYTGAAIDSITVINGGAPQTLTPAQAGCTLTANVLSCTYGAGTGGFAVGATYVVNLHATAPGTAQCITNTASVLGNEQDNGTQTSDSQTCVVVPTPHISLTKTPNPTSVNAIGQVVTYTFVVTNDGELPLTSVTVADTFTTGGSGPVSAITCAAGTNGSFSLAVGASTTCSMTYTVTAVDILLGEIANTATVTGTPPTGAPVTASATATVAAVAIQSFSIRKAVSGPGIDGVVAYSITVSNTGNVPYTGTGADSAGFIDDLSQVLDDATFQSQSVTTNPIGAGWVITGPTGSTPPASNLVANGPLGVGQSVTVGYQVTINSPDTGDHTLVNSVTPTGNGGSCLFAGLCTTSTTVGQSVQVNKTWIVKDAAGTVLGTYNIPSQGGDTASSVPAGFSAAPTLTAQSNPVFGTPYGGYTLGTSVVVGEGPVTVPAGCTVASQQMTAVNGATLPTAASLPYTGTVIAPPTPNTYTITNTVTCTQTLTLVKQVGFGNLPATDWTLTGTGPSGSLAGPAGTTGTPATTSVNVTPQAAYALDESSTAPGSENYIPDAAGWSCVNGALPVTVAMAAVMVGYGQNVTCTIVNSTAQVALLKHIQGTGGLTANEFNLTVTPPSGLGSANTFAGSETPNAANTFEVQPGTDYPVSEQSLSSSTAFLSLGLQKSIDGGSTWTDVTGDAITGTVGTLVLYRFVNESVTPIVLPLTGGIGTDVIAYWALGLLALAAALVAVQLYRRRRAARL
jgi:uncharacterized repeat protein (TIGR01451 family)